MQRVRAEAVAELLVRQDEWLVRRKLAIQLVDYQWHHRRLTIDYELSPSFFADLPSSEPGEVLIPVSLLEKAAAQTMMYNLSDGGGARLSLPSFEESLGLSREVFEVLSRELLVPAHRASYAYELEVVAEAIGAREIEETERARATAALRALRDSSEAWPDGGSCETFCWLAGSLISRCIVAVKRRWPVDGRQILKLEFLDSQARTSHSRSKARAGLAPYPLLVELAAWQPCSLHVELVAPEGVEILRCSLQGISQGVPDPHGARPEVIVYQDSESAAAVGSAISSAPLVQPRARLTNGRRAHLYVNRPARAEQLRLEVAYRVARMGFVSAAAWVTAVIAACLLAITIGLPSFREHDDGGTALLLVLPALGASLVTQYGGVSNLALAMLTTLRRAVYAASALALAAAALLMIDSPHPLKHGDLWHWLATFFYGRWPWGVMSFLGIWLALLAYVSRHLPSDATNIKLRHQIAATLVRPLSRILSWD